MATIQQPLDTARQAPAVAASGSPGGGRARVAGARERARRFRMVPVSRWFTRLLRTPLTVKLLGANLLIAAAALGAALPIERRDGAHPQLLWNLAGALGLALIGNVLLVKLALRPLRSLIEAAERV